MLAKVIHNKKLWTVEEEVEAVRRIDGARAEYDIAKLLPGVWDCHDELVYRAAIDSLLQTIAAIERTQKTEAKAKGLQKPAHWFSNSTTWNHLHPSVVDHYRASYEAGLTRSMGWLRSRSSGLLPEACEGLAKQVESYKALYRESQLRPDIWDPFQPPLTQAPHPEGLYTLLGR